jgi:hypothetical protein
LVEFGAGAWSAGNILGAPQTLIHLGDTRSAVAMACRKSSNSGSDGKPRLRNLSIPTAIVFVRHRTQQHTLRNLSSFAGSLVDASCSHKIIIRSSEGEGMWHLDCYFALNVTAQFCSGTGPKISNAVLGHYPLGRLDRFVHANPISKSRLPCYPPLEARTKGAPRAPCDFNGPA